MLALALIACGAEQPDHADLAPDGSAGPDDAPRPDAAPAPDDSPDPDAAPSPCDLDEPFGAPVPMPGFTVGPVDELDARLSADELTLYVTRRPVNEEGATTEIFVATRATPGEPFELEGPLPNVDVAGLGERAPTVTDDGLELFLSSPAGDEDGLDRIHRLSRASADAPFPAPSPATLVPALASSYPTEETDVYARGDGQELVLASNRSGVFRLYRSDRTESGFGLPQRNELVADSFGQSSPVLSEDGLTLYFANRQSGFQSKVWRATRASTDEPFTDAAQVTEVNPTTSYEVLAPTDLSSDGCTLYLSGRLDVGGTGGYDLFTATRPK